MATVSAADAGDSDLAQSPLTTVLLRGFFEADAGDSDDFSLDLRAGDVVAAWFLWFLEEEEDKEAEDDDVDVDADDEEA
jgi:hypothetical protein